jgi:hypothetical protein
MAKVLWERFLIQFPYLDSSHVAFPVLLWLATWITTGPSWKHLLHAYELTTCFSCLHGHKWGWTLKSFITKQFWKNPLSYTSCFLSHLLDLVDWDAFYLWIWLNSGSRIASCHERNSAFYKVLTIPAWFSKGRNWLVCNLHMSFSAKVGNDWFVICTMRFSYDWIFVGLFISYFTGTLNLWTMRFSYVWILLGYQLLYCYIEPHILSGSTFPVWLRIYVSG